VSAEVLAYPPAQRGDLLLGSGLIQPLEEDREFLAA